MLAAYVGCQGAETGLLHFPIPPSDATYTVLFTGFGQFLNFSTNPTMEMAQYFQQNPCWEVGFLPPPGSADADWTAAIGMCFEAHVLPVNRTGAMWTTNHLDGLLSNGSTLPYHAILHTGLEDTAKGLKLEVAASNQMANDTGGPSTQPAIPGAPALLPTTVNLGWIALGTLAQGAGPYLTNETELWSRNAGDYYCNEVLFRTLNIVRERHVTSTAGPLLPAMFVHAPAPATTTLQENVAVVKQVAAHMVWSTYQNPPFPSSGGGGGGSTPAQSPDTVSLRGGTLALVLAGTLAIGVVLAMVGLACFGQVGRRAPAEPPVYSAMP